MQHTIFHRKAGRYLIALICLLIINCQSSQKRTGKPSDKNALSPDQVKLQRLLHATTNEYISDTTNETSTKKTTNLNSSKKRHKITNNHNDRYGRPVFSSISADNLLHEKITKNGRTITRLTLTGNTILKHNHLRIRAKRIIIEGGEIGTMTGGVHIYDTQNKINIYAMEAHYNQKEQLLRLIKNPYLQRYSNKKRFYLTCQRMLYYIANKRFKLNKDVRGSYGEHNLLGDEGVYDAEQYKLTLKDKPVIITKDMYLIAKHLSYSEKKHFIQLENKAVLYWRDNGNNLSYATGRKTASSKAKRKSTKPIYINNSKKLISDKLTIVTANSMQYNFSKGKANFLEANGNVIATQTNTWMSAKHLRFSGPQMRDIVAKGGVHMIDHEYKVEYQAENMHFDNQAQKFTLRKDVWLSFYNEKDSTPTVFSGGIIERDIKKKQIMMQSHVQLRQKNYHAFAEIGHYYESKELIVLEGNPGLQRGHSFLRSEKIFIYPQKDHILFHNRIQGAF